MATHRDRGKSSALYQAGGAAPAVPHRGSGVARPVASSQVATASQQSAAASTQGVGAALLRGVAASQESAARALVSSGGRFAPATGRRFGVLPPPPPAPPPPPPVAPPRNQADFDFDVNDAAVDADVGAALSAAVAALAQSCGSDDDDVFGSRHSPLPDGGGQPPRLSAPEPLRRRAQMGDSSVGAALSSAAARAPASAASSSSVRVVFGDGTAPRKRSLTGAAASAGGAAAGSGADEDDDDDVVPSGRRRRSVKHSRLSGGSSGAELLREGADGGDDESLGADALRALGHQHVAAAAHAAAGLDKGGGDDDDDDAVGGGDGAVDGDGAADGDGYRKYDVGGMTMASASAAGSTASWSVKPPTKRMQRQSALRHGSGRDDDGMSLDEQRLQISEGRLLLLPPTDFVAHLFPPPGSNRKACALAALARPATVAAAYQLLMWELPPLPSTSAASRQADIEARLKFYGRFVSAFYGHPDSKVTQAEGGQLVKALVDADIAWAEWAAAHPGVAGKQNPRPNPIGTLREYYRKARCVDAANKTASSRMRQLLASVPMPTPAMPESTLLTRIDDRDGAPMTPAELATAFRRMLRLPCFMRHSSHWDGRPHNVGVGTLVLAAIPFLCARKVDYPHIYGMPLHGEPPSDDEGDSEGEAGAAAAGASSSGPTLPGHHEGTHIRVQDAVHSLAPARVAVLFMHLLRDATGVPLEPSAFAAGMAPHRGALTDALSGRALGTPLTPAALFSALCGHFADGLERARVVCRARGWLPAPEAQRNEETPLAPVVVQRAPAAAAGGSGAAASGNALTAAEAEAVNYDDYFG